WTSHQAPGAGAAFLPWLAGGATRTFGDGTGPAASDTVAWGPAVASWFLTLTLTGGGLPFRQLGTLRQGARLELTLGGRHLGGDQFLDGRPLPPRHPAQQPDHADDREGGRDPR